jgi:hypothetical protein
MNYDSLDGFQTSVWGPPAWLFLHTVSFNYPPRAPTKRRAAQYKRFFESVGCVLPCGACRDNYCESVAPGGPFEITPAVLRDRGALSLWLFRLHNHITERAHPSRRRYRRGSGEELAYYGDIRDRYNSFRASCGRGARGCVRPVGGNKKYRCMLHVKPRHRCSGKSCTFSLVRKKVAGA